MFTIGRDVCLVQLCKILASKQTHGNNMYLVITMLTCRIVPHPHKTNRVEVGGWPPSAPPAHPWAGRSNRRGDRGSTCKWGRDGPPAEGGGDDVLILNTWITSDIVATSPKRRDLVERAARHDLVVALEA